MPQRLLTEHAGARDEMLLQRVKASEQAGLGTEALRIRTLLAPQYISARSSVLEERTGLHAFRYRHEYIS